MKISLPLAAFGRGWLMACCLSLFLVSGLFGQAPPNDDCENAIPIELGEMVTADNTGATPENVTVTGDNCTYFQANTSSDEGIWYSFVAPAEPINIIFYG
jgi:hypothetical protein